MNSKNVQLNRYLLPDMSMSILLTHETAELLIYLLFCSKPSKTGLYGSTCENGTTKFHIFNKKSRSSVVKM